MSTAAQKTFRGQPGSDLGSTEELGEDLGWFGHLRSIIWTGSTIVLRIGVTQKNHHSTAYV